MLRWPGTLEICWNLRRDLGLAVELINTQDDEDGWSWMVFLHLLLVKVFLHVPGPLQPILDERGRQRYGEWANWGFRFAEDIVFSWGYDRRLRCRWPWAWEFERSEVQLPGGQWVESTSRRIQRQAKMDGLHVWELERAIRDQAQRPSYPYRYTLRSGEAQERTATIYVSRSTWRRLSL